MFQRLLNWIREAIGKMLNITSIRQGLGNINIALTPEMTSALQLWAYMYANRSPWVNNEIKSLNLAAAIASEIARSVTIEMDVQISGSPRADFLSERMEEVVDKLRTHTEYACAKGGMWFKPYIKGDSVVVDYVQADMGYPVAFDTNGKMTSCIFADQKIIGANYYTRLEYHTLLSDGYHITNMAFRSTTRDTLGTQVPLSSVDTWAELEPEAIIIGVDKPLFAYFKMPFANNIDPTSALGVSVYARAVGLIEQADKQWSDFLWEFESGKRALYTDVNAFKQDPATKKPILPDKRLYRLLDLQGKIDQPGLFEDWTPTLREVNLLNGLDAILRRIEFNCGLSYGVLSNPEAVALTATEIKAGKQRFYATITDTQKALECALEDLLYAIDVWVTLGNLAPSGTYDAVYTFDDSIVADHDTAFQQDLLVLGQVMSKVEFRMRNYGETEEIAKEKIQMMLDEQGDVSFFPPRLTPGTDNPQNVPSDMMNNQQMQNAMNGA